jgi:hypothetical protein
MARLAARAPTLTLWRVARAVGRGAVCASAPTWPEGPKEGSRRPARHGPRRPPSCGRMQRQPAPSAYRARRLCTNGGPPPARRASRALEVVERVLTARLPAVRRGGAACGIVHDWDAERDHPVVDRGRNSIVGCIRLGKQVCGPLIGGDHG